MWIAQRKGEPAPAKVAYRAMFGAILWLVFN
jgi:hypothetical protein